MPKKVTAQEAATMCACQKVRIAARAVTRAYDEVLRPTGLRSTQFTVLVAASVAAGIPLNRLATVLGLERTTLTRSLDGIEKEGAHPGGKCRRSHGECRTDAARQ